MTLDAQRLLLSALDLGEVGEVLVWPSLIAPPFTRCVVSCLLGYILCSNSLLRCWYLARRWYQRVEHRAVLVH